MVTRLRLEMNGRVEFSRELDDVRVQLDDWTPAFEQMVDDFKVTEKAIFANRGVYEGLSPRWASLSPAYKAWKEKHFPGRPILVLTGRLRAMLTGEGTGLKVVMNGRALTISADYPVGKWNLIELHHTGTHWPNKRVKMPPRPAFRLTNPQKTRWAKYLHEHLLEEILRERALLGREGPH